MLIYTFLLYVKHEMYKKYFIEIKIQTIIQLVSFFFLESALPGYD